jgi:hypothetical protein
MLQIWLQGRGDVQFRSRVAAESERTETLQIPFAILNQQFTSARVAGTKVP